MGANQHERQPHAAPQGLLGTALARIVMASRHRFRHCTQSMTRVVRARARWHRPSVLSWRFRLCRVAPGLPPRFHRKEALVARGMAENIERAWTPGANPWLIAVVVALAAFMEVLDTSIANVALPHIAGRLGGQRRREHLGAHLLSRLQRDRAADQRLVRRRCSAASGSSWPASSCSPSARCCAASRRACAADPVPHHAGRRRRRTAADGAGHPGRRVSAGEAGMAFALYGIAAVMAPAIGPTLGGWITDNYTLALDLPDQRAGRHCWR